MRKFAAFLMLLEDTFKWKNGKLKRISSKKTPLFD